MTVAEASTTAAPPRDRAMHRVAALLVVTFVAECAFLAHSPLAARVLAVPDDSLFYLQVAREFWRTGELTFDGTGPTYGFQPLWQLVCIALAAVLPGRLLLFHGCLAVCCALHVATGGVLFALGRRLGGTAVGVAAMAAWTWTPDVMQWCWGLKENGLYALLLATALLQLHGLLADAAQSRRHVVLWGVVLGLAVFTRVNAVLTASVLLAVPIAAALRPVGGEKLVRRVGVGIVTALVAAVAAVVVAGPWYLFAKVHFGSALPTSGVWKLGHAKAFVETNWGTAWCSAAHLGRAAQELPRYLEFLSRACFGSSRPLLLAALVLGALRPWRRPEFAAAMVLGAALVAGACATLADQMLLPNFVHYGNWYAVAFCIAVPVLLAVPAARALWWLRDWRRVPVAAVVVAAAFWWLPPDSQVLRKMPPDVLTTPPRAGQLLEMGLWAARHVPREANIGIWDPGIVSYFSGRHFVSFDPLIASIDAIRPEVMLDPVGRQKRENIDYMFGTANLENGTLVYLNMLPGTFDVLWEPYPDFELGWDNPVLRHQHYVVVRPRHVERPPCFADDDFPCGVLWPNDPARRRVVTRDRDRLVAGVDLDADVVRLLVDVPANGPGLELRVGGAAIATWPAGTRGWQFVDVRGRRGGRAQIALGGDVNAAAGVVAQAQLLDFSLPD